MGGAIWLYERAFRHRILRFILLQRWHLLFTDPQDLKPLIVDMPLLRIEVNSPNLHRFAIFPLLIELPQHPTRSSAHPLPPSLHANNSLLMWQKFQWWIPGCSDFILHYNMDQLILSLIYVMNLLPPPWKVEDVFWENRALKSSSHALVV